MNTNSNNNVNAQMIALGRAISNPHGAGTSTSNSTNKDNYINGIFQGTNHLPYFYAKSALIIEHFLEGIILLRY